MLGLHLKPADKNGYFRVHKVKNRDSYPRVVVEFRRYDIGIFYVVLNRVPVVIVCPEKLFPCMDTGKGFFYVLGMVSAGIK